MKRKLCCLILAVCLILCLAPAVAAPSSAAYNPYPSWQDVTYPVTVPCTYRAWQLAYERMGVELPAWGNALKWFDNARNSGFSVGYTARVNSIVVYSGVWFNGIDYGHVAYVTEVYGSTMYVDEGGRSDVNGDGSLVYPDGLANHQISDTAAGQGRGHGFSTTVVGYIYLDGVPELTVPTDRASMAEGTYYLVPACAPDFRLDVATASYDEGATLQLWEPIDYDAQRFIVHDLGDALYTITAKHSNMVLDVWAAGTYSGADVKQHPWNGGKNEQWFFIDAGDGYYYIRPVHCPAMSLDVCNGDSRNAANVQIWESNSSNAQKWKLVPCDAPAESAAVQPADIHFPRVNIYHQDQFTDVKANQWFTNTVASAFEMGLMKGTSNTAFQPYGDVTIAQAITMAARIHSIASTGSENFVQTGKWYQVYLDYAYQNGIIDIAYYNSDVTRNATRAQFAEIFANSLPDNLLPAVNQVADGAVPDVPMSAACASYVYKLYRAGILAGSDATGAFHPLTYITRAEAATIVSRMADSSSRVSITLG